MPEVKRNLAQILCGVDVPREETPKSYRLPWKAKPGELQEVPWFGSEKNTVQLQITKIKSSYDYVWASSIVGLVCSLIAILSWGQIPFWILIFPLPIIPVAIGCVGGSITAILNSPRVNTTTRERLIILENELAKAAARDEAREARYQERISVAIEERRLRLQRISHWLTMDGHTFEVEFAELLRKRGWSVEVTKASGDGGIDVQGTDDLGESVAIQCKRWKNKVGAPAIRDLRGAGLGKFNRLVVIGTGGFSKSALAFAEESGIELWDAGHLEVLLREEPARLG